MRTALNLALSEIWSAFAAWTTMTSSVMECTTPEELSQSCSRPQRAAYSQCLNDLRSIPFWQG